MAHPRLNRSLFSRYSRRARYVYLKLLLMPDTPSRVARGLGAGVFAGFLPIIPVQTITAVSLASLLRGSVVVAAVGTWVTNPVTVAPFYAAFFYLGRALTPYGGHLELPEVWNLKALLAVGLDAGLAALIGGMIIGAIMAPIAYILALKYLARLQNWERRKLRERFVLPPPHTE
jgi:hypothetical protein